MQKLHKHYEGKRVLLTGHTGFKGSWMLVALQELNAEVWGISLSAENNSFYNSINGDSLCKSVICDIRNESNLRKLIVEINPDIVFHFAAQPLVLDSYENPIYTFETNVCGTVNVLNSIRHIKKQCEIIVITTDKVYENKEWSYPYREIDALGGHDPYSASKACAEIVVSSFRKSFFQPEQYSDHKKSIVTARAGNVIGGGDWSKNRILPDTVKSIFKNEKLTLRNPHSIRPWQHVLDALFGYLILGAKLHDNPEKYSKAYNFGPINELVITVEELVQYIIQIWGYGNYEILSEVNDFHESARLMLDCSSAVNDLAWHPRWNTHHAIKHTVEWYKNVMLEIDSPLDITKKQVKSYFSTTRND
ncbi:CDP-glucose 4,6-dehydratase [Methylobacter sp. BlB1]|nr:CDP-glucose 4,6-dehydratase [Methylobacter sp. BlB1]